MNPFVVAFTTDDGEVFEIPDLPEDLGRACALASEATLRKFWDTPEGDAAWQYLEGPGIASWNGWQQEQNERHQSGL